MNTNKVNEIDSNVMLESHAKYTPQGTVNLLVENQADAISYRKDGVVSKTSDSLTFDLDISEHFFDRGVFINWTSIPLEFVFNKVIPKGTTTNFNCIELLNDICLREVGMMNAVSSINTTVDGQSFTTNSVDKTFKIISPYYEKSALNYVVDASIPDKNSSYLLNGNSVDWIPTISTDGKNMIIRAPKLNPMDPFESTVDPEYNSRNLVLEDLSFTDDTTNIKSIKANLKNLTLFLPFNLFTSYNDDTPIYNGNKIKVILNLQSNWINRIFSMKPLIVGDPLLSNSTIGNAPYTVKLQTDAFSANGNGEIDFHYRLYKPPTEILNKLDYAKPYIRQYPLVELDSRSQDIEFSASDITKNIVSTPFDTRAIPKKIYIALCPKMESDDQLKTETNHYCRFDNLAIEMHGTTTDIANGNSSESLYHLCKENGLQMNKNEALYLRGFPICIDTSNNIAGKGNSLIGVNNNASGKYTFRIKGQVTRLQTDRVAFKINNFTSVADMKNRNSKKYEFNVIFVYSCYFVYNMFGKKFSLLESLSMDQLAVLDKNVNDLYVNFVPKMDVIGGSTMGGSIFSVIGDAAKGVGKGLLNVIRATISNKNGLRDKLLDAYNNKGGAFLDGHDPLGGNNYSQSRQIGGFNQRGGMSLNDLMGYNP